MCVVVVVGQGMIDSERNVEDKVVMDIRWVGKEERGGRCE